MKQSQIFLDFVFIASCHSEAFANIFFEAGADHVIGIKKKEMVIDSACVTFTRAFYKRLWQSGAKICVCYEQAVNTVKMAFGDDEANKFLIMRDHETKLCKIDGNFRRGIP